MTGSNRRGWGPGNGFVPPRLKAANAVCLVKQSAQHSFVHLFACGLFFNERFLKTLIILKPLKVLWVPEGQVGAP